MFRNSFRVSFSVFLLALAALFLSNALIFPASALAADDKPAVWSDREKPIVQQLQGLRNLPDDVRARTTKDLALQIRQLPAL